MSFRLQRTAARNRIDNFLCCDNRAGVVWEIVDESRVHEFLGVIGSRVLHHGDVVSEFSGLPYGRFDACVRDQAGDNQPLDAMPFELQIEIGVGKAAGAPMLLGHNVSRLWGKLRAILASPSSVFERLS